MAASPLPSRGLTNGRNCYVTLAFLGVPKKGDKIRIGYLTLALFRARKWANCYVTHALSGFPNAKRGEPKQKWLPHPCLLGGAKQGANATSPLHSQGSPTPSAGSKIRSGYLTPAFSGAQKRAEMLCHPAFSAVPNAKCGEKIRDGRLVPAFSGTHKWAESLCNPCILGGPQTRGQNQNWQPHPRLLRGPQVGELLRNPCILGGPLCQVRGENQKWLPHPCLLGGPRVGANATPALHSRGSPNKGTKSKVRASGTRTKLSIHCGYAAQKNITEKNFAPMVCLH